MLTGQGQQPDKQMLVIMGLSRDSPDLSTDTWLLSPVLIGCVRQKGCISMLTCYRIAPAFSTSIMLNILCSV